MKYIQEIFDIERAKAFDLVGEIIDEQSKEPQQYKFISNVSFEKLALRDMQSAGAQYWYEILDRAHFSSYTTLVRTRDWLNAMDGAFGSNNFLSFLTSLRALVEFTGDTTHALQSVPLGLASNSQAIVSTLNRSAKGALGARNLEDTLIHYTHGRKLRRTEASFESHIAKRTVEYVKSLEPFEPRVYELYTELCGFAHPAAQSLAAHMIPANSENWVLIVDPGKEVISSFIDKWRPIYLDLPCIAINQALCTLKVLSLIDKARYSTHLLEGLDLSKVPLWQKCRAEMHV